MRFFLSSGALALLAAACSGGDVFIGDDGGGSDSSSDGAPVIDGSNDAIATNDGSIDSGPTFGGRLLVTQASAGVAVWDGVDALAADTAPTFTMTSAAIAGGTRGAMALAGRLIVAPGAGGLVAFDNAATLGAGAAPSAIVPASAFVKPASLSALPIATSLSYNEKTDTLWASGFWGTDRFDEGATLSSSSVAAALLSHAYLQVPGFAYDAIGDRAFLGQISGAGLVAFDNAKSASGTPALDFTLDQKMAAWSLAIAQDRLYAIGGDTGNGTTPRESIDVWKTISTVSASKPPDFSITSGIAPQDFSPFVTVASDMLIACIQSGKVLVWKGASALTADKAPDFTLTTQLTQPAKVVYGAKTNRFYVLDSQGVAIYAQATTAPTFVAKITTGLVKPQDLVVLE